MIHPQNELDSPLDQIQIQRGWTIHRCWNWLAHMLPTELSSEWPHCHDDGTARYLLFLSILTCSLLANTQHDAKASYDLCSVWWLQSGNKRSEECFIEELKSVEPAEPQVGPLLQTGGVQTSIGKIEHGVTFWINMSWKLFIVRLFPIWFWP